jgi:hypothetical protein
MKQYLEDNKKGTLTRQSNDKKAIATSGRVYQDS